MAIIGALAVVLAGLGVGGVVMATRTSDREVQVAPRITVKLSGEYNVHATAAPAAAKASLAGKPMVPLATMLDYHASKPVPGGTQIRYQIKKGLLPSTVFEAYWDPRTGRWIHEPVIYNPTTGVAVAQVGHFSIRDVFMWGWDQVTQAVKDAVTKVFGGFFGTVDHPKCGNPNGVWMSYTGGNSSMYTCHDATVASPPTATDPGKADIAVNLANARNYSVDVSRPDNASVTINDHGDPNVELVDWIGGTITQLVNKREGEQMSILPGGATDKVAIPGVQAPFDKLHLRTQLDGEAYLVGILKLAVDELAWMYNGVTKASLGQDILDELSKGQIIYKALTELRSIDLSFDTVKTLTDLAKDIVLDAIKHNPFSPMGLYEAGTILFEAVSTVGQTISGAVDNVSGAAFHKFSFGTFGTTWVQSSSDLRQYDWQSVTIPGQWFDGPAEVKLTAGQATVPTAHGKLVVTAVPGDVIYGDLFGDRQTDAAIEVWVDNGGGTAASQAAEAWVVYKPGASGPVAVGAATPRIAPITSWGVNPRNAPHISYITNVTIEPGKVLCDESFYNPGDIDANPTGHVTYQYSLINGELIAPPDISGAP